MLNTGLDINRELLIDLIIGELASCLDFALLYFLY